MIAELTELEEAPSIEPRFELDNASFRNITALPAGLVFAEAAVAALRAELVEAGNGNWQIFQTDMEFWAILQHAAPNATWRSLPALSGGEPMQKLDEHADRRLWWTRTGIVTIESFDCVLARWMLIDPASAEPHALRLIAAPSVEAVDRLLKHVRERQTAECTATWQIVTGAHVNPHQRPPRLPVDPKSLVIDKAIVARLESEAVGFFTEPVAAMYRTLRVPLRRGILLYGPPGNGKTSTIRYLGGRLPKVTAMLLRPNNAFGTDALVAALDRWKAQAPAMLIIEDLNWLLTRIDLSVFLNALDGIETEDTKGLLLVASTNHPDKLDTALSNRPGRFDVVIEMPLPGDDLRRRYLAIHLPAIDAELAETLVRSSDGLSFAHLGEILRIAGLTAIAEGRSERTTDDLLSAVEVVCASNKNAERGFVGKLPPFGLQALVRR